MVASMPDVGGMSMWCNGCGSLQFSGIPKPSQKSISTVYEAAPGTGIHTNSVVLGKWTNSVPFSGESCSGAFNLLDESSFEVFFCNEMLT